MESKPGAGSPFTHPAALPGAGCYKKSALLELPSRAMRCTKCGTESTTRAYAAAGNAARALETAAPTMDFTAKLGKDIKAMKLGVPQ